MNAFPKLWYRSTNLFRTALVLNVNYKLTSRQIKLNNPVRLYTESKDSTFEEPGRLQGLQLKKRRKAKSLEIFKSPGVYNVSAVPTSEEINMEDLLPVLIKELDVVATHYRIHFDFIKATFEESPGCEPQEIFVFREGVVVLWNVPMNRKDDILRVIREFEQHRYTKIVKQEETATIPYRHNYLHESVIGLSEKNEIVISVTGDVWEKYVASLVVAATAKVGVWERQLEKYIRSVEFVTEDLKYGKKLSISQNRILRKYGALFALRHVINLSSILLEKPYVPCKQEQLAKLHNEMMIYYGIQKRLRIIKDKMTHSLEMIELLTNHLQDKHRLRLESLVILLIVIEVFFESFYFYEKIMHKPPQQNSSDQNKSSNK